MNMGLREAYLGLMTDMGNQDADWVHYVRDNYQMIVDTSRWMYLDKFKHNTMRHRIEDFLRDEFLDADITWIIFLINQIGSNADFINLDRLLVPDMDVLKKLRQQFVSIRSNFKQVRQS